MVKLIKNGNSYMLTIPKKQICDVFKWTESTELLIQPEYKGRKIIIQEAEVKA